MDTRHEIIPKKVDKCVNRGEARVLMGDTNSAMNPGTTKKSFAAKEILAWKAENKVIILNIKNIPPREISKKGDQTNCLDLIMVNPNLKQHVKKSTVDRKREWTPSYK